jgi:hypothetical protein
VVIGQPPPGQARSRTIRRPASSWRAGRWRPPAWRQKPSGSELTQQELAEAAGVIDVALAQCEAKLYDQAANTLISVGLDAPEWVKHQALPGVIGKRLAKVSTSKVRRISEVIGVPLIA